MAIQKTLLFLSLLNVLNSCGQTIRDSVVFDAIANDVCNCTRNGDTTRQVEKLFNSCLDKSLMKYKEQLAKLNITLDDSTGSAVLYEEVTKKRFSIACSNIFNLIMNEIQAEKRTHNSFVGIVMSEKQLERDNMKQK